jgi:hypothetical protein
VFLYGQNDSIKIFIKECSRFTAGSVCRVKWFHLDDKRFVGDVEVEAEVQKWLRQQSKVFYVADFDALVKQWDKCTSVGGGYVEI